MERRSGVSLVGGIALGAALLALDAVVERRREIVEVDQYMPVPPERVIELIMQVERESEFIPIISSVKVISREHEQVVYDVRGAGPFPVSVRYRKWRESLPPEVRWEAIRGSFGFRENGRIIFTVQGRGCIAHLWSEHWIEVPVAGRIAAPMATATIKSQLQTWLRNLSGELEKEALRV